MMSVDYVRLAYNIRAFAGISTKLMAQDMEARLADHWPGISVPQYGVLRILDCHPSTIKELSDRMMLAPSTLVPIIDRLEGEGLVVRGKDPEDRRRTPLLLTDHAREMLAQVPAVDAQDSLCRALHTLGPEKSEHLNHLLQMLVSELAPDHDIVQHVLATSAQAAATGARGKIKRSSAR